MPNMNTRSKPGIDGNCPRCSAVLMLRTGGWRGIVEMASVDKADGRHDVHYCLMCGHYEDAVIRENRKPQGAVMMQEAAV